MSVPKNSEKTVAELNRLIADSTVFYQKLRHYHWNVGGEEFYTLHEKFEEIYNNWALFIDEMAERVVYLGGMPLHTLADLLETARIQEDPSVPTDREMVERLLADMDAMHTSMGRLVPEAEEGGDRGTANRLDDIRDRIEDDVWMLKSWLKRRG